MFKQITQLQQNPIQISFLYKWIFTGNRLLYNRIQLDPNDSQPSFDYLVLILKHLFGKLAQ